MSFCHLLAILAGLNIKGLRPPALWVGPSQIILPDCQTYTYLRYCHIEEIRS